jgi:pilus assembly protein Flp/PilA
MQWAVVRAWLEACSALLFASAQPGDPPAELQGVPDERGQGLVEYALIMVLVVLVAFVLLTIVGPWVGNVFSNVVNNI